MAQENRMSKGVLKMRDGFDWKRVAWGAPDSPQRALCSYCHGGIGEDDVPLMMWGDDGSMMQLCEPCIQQWVEGVVIK
jgi:hypothetical protein